MQIQSPFLAKINLLPVDFYVKLHTVWQSILILRTIDSHIASLALQNFWGQQTSDGVWQVEK